MRKIALLIFANLIYQIGFTQKINIDSLHAKKDSSLRAMIHADSLKIEKEYAEIERWEKIKAVIQIPAINAGKFSGIVPVNDVTEIPDPNINYKILFEVAYGNPDSMAKEPNYALVEIARVINLHIASGIPANKIMPVILVHAKALNAICNNAHYQELYKMDNPNLTLIRDLEDAGAKFIACGQAMAFFNVKKEELLPEIKVVLSAQTILTSYQLKGYVWRMVDID
jgi:intracellular sulfur oxidation DsrE/DsrF family protein